jgi:hypothetical protein
MFTFLPIAFVLLSCLIEHIQATVLMEKRQTSYLDLNYDFVGCYTGVGPAPLSQLEVILGDAKMNYERCAVGCSQFDYFGISQGTDCICGTSINNPNPVAVTSCSSQCSGLGASTVAGRCGGPKPGALYVMSIFVKKITGQAVGLPGEIQQSYSMGCYAIDTPQAIYAMNGAITVDRCQVICRGYQIFGIFSEAGRCFCYDNFDQVKTSDGLCDVTCAGGTCGGYAQQSVYSTNAPCQSLDQQILLKNSGFEGGTAYWDIRSNYGPMTWAVRSDTTTAFQGLRYARLDSKAVGNYMALAQDVKSFCPGVEYQVSWSAKESANSECDSWIAVTRGSRLGIQSDGQSWTLHSSRFFAPSIVTELSFIVQCDGQGSGGFRKFYLDNFRLTRYESQ